MNIINLNQVKEKIIYQENDINFYSDEWETRNTQCINFCNASIGKFDKRIAARKCDVLEINSHFGKEFIEQHHIQGSNNLGIVFFALNYDGEILGVMSLGRHHRQMKENTIVLDRLCFKFGVQVIGGANKLLKACFNWAKLMKYDLIISFSDNRITSGKIYEKMGFSLERNYKPDYFYIENSTGKRYSKQSQKKKTVKCPEHLTEKKWCEIRGLSQYCDCGKKRWSLKINPEYESWNEKTSYNCAVQHSQGVFHQSHIRGYFSSIKNNKSIYYASSYELRCLYLLEKDEKVLSFERGPALKINNGKWRNPDLMVIKKDGPYLYEVKPKSNVENAKEQIENSISYAQENNICFKLWTEDDSELEDEKQIVEWSKNFIKETTGDTSYEEKQKEGHCKRQQKYYANNIKNNKVVICCDYCLITHEILEVSYKQNIDNNGRYICSIENGHIIGSKPKNRNLYADQNKRKCSRCSEIKDFNEFYTKKAHRCIICEKEYCKEKYKKRKLKLNN